MSGRPSPERTAAIRETIRVALGNGRATAIAQAIADEPPAHTLAAEVAEAKEPFDAAVVALDELAAALAAETARADKAQEYARAYAGDAATHYTAKNALAARLEAETQLRIQFEAEVREWVSVGERQSARLRDVRRRLEQAREALKRIKANAEDWHGPNNAGSGHAKALAVIAQWCDAALAARALGVPSRGEPTAP